MLTFSSRSCSMVFVGGTEISPMIAKVMCKRFSNTLAHLSFELSIFVYKLTRPFFSNEFMFFLGLHARLLASINVYLGRRSKGGQKVRAIATTEQYLTILGLVVIEHTSTDP